MKYILILLISTTLFSCLKTTTTQLKKWAITDDEALIAESQKNASSRMKYKLVYSQINDKNKVLKSIAKQLGKFSEKDYQKYYPLVFDKEIISLQNEIERNTITYEQLTKWYLYRMLKYESNPSTALNAIISVNPEAVEEAKNADKNKKNKEHPIYGIPVLAKDNIGFIGLPTTAGAAAFKNNNAPNAFIINQIKTNGGIIIAKTNLSEWANYLCGVCPNGYSAVGGQTLNPYGRGKLDTGGSSSGSGVAIAANYAAVAIGTETSGSILSPSSSNSLVGLKPTVGRLSRGGIVPISGTLDTPGPMTKNVLDNAILLSAMSGKDIEDPAMTKNIKKLTLDEITNTSDLKGMRFGVFKEYLKDSLYALAIKKVKLLGGVLVEIEPEKVNFDGFGSLLNIYMKADLPAYISKYGDKTLSIKNVADVMKFNSEDSLRRIPYGQARFEGILNDTTSETGFYKLKYRLNQEGIRFFETPMQKHQLDAVLSINNYNAGFAAAAKYPALTVPMGYSSKTNQPFGLTFIARPYEENKLLKMGYAFEKNMNVRKSPF